MNLKYTAIFIIILAIVVGGAYFFMGGAILKDSSDTAADKIVVRLKWLHQAQFAGLYIADKNGMFLDNGIQAELLPFDYKKYPIDEVVNGNAQFGVVGADELLLARAQGKKIKAIATIYQENPVVAYTLKTSGIKTIQDFVGKKIGMEKGVNVETTIRAMLAAQGIDYDKQMKEVPIGFDALALIRGDVDISTGYVTNEPIQAEEAGYEVITFAPSAYGAFSYSDVLFTTEDMIAKNPDLVKRFVKATLAGWDYALANPEEAVRATLQYKDPNNTALNYAHQKALFDKSIPLIKPARGTVVGQMNYIYWRRTYDILRKYGGLDTPLDITQAYTTEFLRESSN